MTSRYWRRRPTEHINSDIRTKSKAIKSQSKPIRDQFFARMRLVKQVATFQTEATEGVFLDELEGEVVSEVWDILPESATNGDYAYEVVTEPMKYLPSYCALSALYEARGYPQFSALPLRRTLVQSHVRIDTKILVVHILGLPETKTMTGLSDEGKRELWRQVFDLKGKAFQPRKQKGLVFDGMVATDGVAISVYLKRPGVRYGSKGMKKSKAVLKRDVEDSYFEKHLDKIRRAPNVVAADPNKRDLLFFRDLRTGATMRYTSNQRAHETRSRRYRKDAEILKLVNDVPSVESRIPTHKTMDFQSYLAYL